MKNHPHHKTFLKFFIIIVFSLWVFPGTVNALTLTPARYEINGNPGETLTEEIILINETSKVETYYSSFSNFEAQGESGSPAFVEPKDDLGTWMTAGEASVTLAPGQQKVVPFTIRIPENAEPGGHFAVIFFGTSPAGGGGQVAVGAKTGALVLLSVNGDVKEEAGLLNFNTVGSKFFYNTLPVGLEYRFRNDGGDRIKPEGQIKIRNTVFLPTDYLNANPVEGNVLPNSIRKIQINWQKYEHPNTYVVPNNFFKKFWSDVYYQWKNFAVGLYSAKLDVAYGSEDIHVTKTTFFFVFPWQLVLVMLTAFVIVFFGGKVFIRRYNKYIIKKATEGTRNGTGSPSRPSNV